MINLQNNKTQNTKIVLFILLPIALCCSLFFIPAIRNLLLSLAENLLLHRELQDKTIWNLRILRFSLLVFCACVFFSSLLLFTDINLSKIHFSAIILFSFAVLIGFCVANLFVINCPETTYNYDNPYDYGDFYDSITKFLHTEKNVYPPLPTVIYTVLSKMITSSISASPSLFTGSYESGYLLMLFFLFSTIPLCILFFCTVKGTRTEKTLFSIAVLLSSPVIFAIQRGNIILLALECTIFYCFTYNSKNKVLSELGLMALAVAAAIKIYPAIFGLLLLKKQNWRKAIRCAFYGLLLFIIPVFFLEEGLSFFQLMINNLTNSVVDSIPRESRSYSLKSNIYFLFFRNSNNLNLFNFAYRMAMIAFVGISAFLIFITKKEYIILFVCASLSMIIPSFSWHYTAAFLVIPFIALLNEEKKNTIDYIFFGIFTMVFAYNGVTYNLPLQSLFPNLFSVNVLLLILCFIDTYIQTRKSKTLGKY